MGDDDLNTVVREGVDGLRRYIRLLESLLASARAAEALFPRVMSSIEGVSLETPTTQARGLGSLNSPQQADSEYGEPYEMLYSALIAERPSGQNRVLQSLRVIAAAGGGELNFGLTCRVLRDAGVCKGTAENVGSYVSRRLRTSDEFQRVGAVGSGKYRWMSYQGDPLENSPDSVADDCGSSHSEEAVESPRA